MRSVDEPDAMRPRVPMEHGTMIMVLYLPEPDAKGAWKSRWEKTGKENWV